MKHFIFVVCGIFMLACTGGDKTEVVEAKPVSLGDTVYVGKQLCYLNSLSDTNVVFPSKLYPDSNDVRQIKKESTTVSRSKDTLTLKCDNDSVVRLVNNFSDGDDYANFQFVELNRDINHYVVVRYGYEYFSFLLVNKKSGKQTWTISDVAVSPDKHMVAAGNCDLIAGFTTNGIELFEMKNGELQSIGLRELNKWGPDELLWENDSTLIMKGETVDSNMVSHSVYKSLYLSKNQIAQ